MLTANRPAPQPILFRFQGIPIRVHRWLLILMGLMTVMAGNQPGGFSGTAMLQTLAALSVLFVAVLVHELGHAFAARRLGIEVADITLWPLGGIAAMRNMPQDPNVEMRIAAAGPLTNLAIGSVALVIWAGMRGGMDWRSLFEARVLHLEGFLGFTALCHLLLGAFNLIPAFPMDGGKILRSILAKRRDWLPATELAVRSGRWIALAFIVYSFVSGNWALLIIALYLLVSGMKELWMTRLRSGNPLGDLGSIFEQATRGRHADNPEESDPEFDALRNGETVARGRPSAGFSDEDIINMESEKGRIR